MQAVTKSEHRTVDTDLLQHPEDQCKSPCRVIRTRQNTLLGTGNSSSQGGKRVAALRKLEAVTTGTRSPAGTALVSATPTPDPTPAAAQSALVQHRPVAEQRLDTSGSQSWVKGSSEGFYCVQQQRHHESQGLRSGYCPKPSMMRNHL